MVTLILFLMGVFVMWRWVLYLWCDHCGNNVRNGKSQFCARCEAQMDLDIEKLLQNNP